MSGGTEHLNSTVIQARPVIFDEPLKYRHFPRPRLARALPHLEREAVPARGAQAVRLHAELHQTPVDRGGHDELLDTLVLARAGLVPPDDFLSMFAGTIHSELTRPGRALQSLEASSYDAWIKFNKHSHDSVNSTVSFYTRGELINFVMDSEIRRLTSDAKSLDDFVRTLYQRFPLRARAYTNDDVLAILKELTGTDFAPFHARFVAGTEDPDIDAALGYFGLELARRRAHRGRPRQGLTGYVGLDVKTDGAGMTVTAVRTDGSAYLAGVNADDRISAVNGEAMNADAFERSSSVRRARLRDHAHPQQAQAGALRHHARRAAHRGNVVHPPLGLGDRGAEGRLHQVASRRVAGAGRARLRRARHAALAFLSREGGRVLEARRRRRPRFPHRADLRRTPAQFGVQAGDRPAREAARHDEAEVF